MLDKFLQKTRGIVLAAIVALLCAVFVLQFGGPQAQGCATATETGATASVYGHRISRSDVRAAFILVGGDRYPPALARQSRLQEMVVYGLVEEALLAREAAELGFSINADDVMEQVIDKGLVYVPMSVNAGQYLPPAGPRRYDFGGKDGEFSKANLKRFIQGGLQRSVRDFTEAQTTATLAQRMRELVMASVEVGPGEIWDAFVREQENVTVSYARFSPSYYKDDAEPSADVIAKFMRDQAAELDAAYQAQRHRYTGLDKQVRARHILIKVANDASDADRTKARKQAQRLLQRARAGEDFAALARQYSQDTASAKKGGDLGFNPKGRMAEPFDEAQFALAPGEVAGTLVETEFGFHIIKVEAVREGDVPVEEAKRELAVELYGKKNAQAKAAQAAEAALKGLAGGMDEDEIPLADKAGDDKDPLAPHFRKTQPFGRAATPVAGAFDGNDFTQAAFKLTEDAPVPNSPLKLGDEYFVFKLVERNEASRQDFTEEEQERLHKQLLSTRRLDVLRDYVRALVKKARSAGEIAIDPVILES